MVACEYPISAPGVLHLATLLIGIVCSSLGFMSHMHSSWVSKQDYRLCETADKLWKSATNAECPDISLETAFLIMVVLCTASSLFWYSCELCCLGNSKTASLFYVVYLVLAGICSIIAGFLFIKSAVMIARLPNPDYLPVLENMGKVLYAAFKSEKSDDLKLTSQSDEQTYYQEKIVTGVLTILNGVLQILCAWLVILDKK